jgi:hypothetical protein
LGGKSPTLSEREEERGGRDADPLGWDWDEQFEGNWHLPFGLLQGDFNFNNKKIHSPSGRSENE